MSVGLLLGGRYELQASLGRGGFGTVWRSHDHRLGRDVAVKLISFDVGPGAERLELAQRFEREAQAVAALNHPNIVTAHDFGVDGDTAYLVMELISGGSLEDELARRRAAGRTVLDERRVLRIAGHVCAGLGAAHAAGLVHRDLKPANLMNGSTGQVKIVDFGIARMSHQSKLTHTGMYLGTFRYTSPEQTRHGPIDGRSDLYTLGCLIYELLTGQSPFDADSPATWIAAHQSVAPKPLRAYLPAAPPALEQLVAELLAKSPDARPADAATVARRLRAIHSGGASDGAGTPDDAVSRPVSVPRPAAPYPHAGQPYPLGPGRHAPGPPPPPPYGYPPSGYPPSGYPASMAAPFGYLVAVRPFLPLVPRPRTVTAAVAVCRLIAVIMIAYAVEVCLAVTPITRAWDLAYGRLAGVTRTSLTTSLVVIIGLAVAAAITALIIAGSIGRGSRVGRVFAWIFLVIGGLQCVGVGNVTTFEPRAPASTATGGSRGLAVHGIGSSVRPVAVDPARLAAADRVFQAHLPRWLAMWTHTFGAFGVAATVALAVLLLLPTSRAYVRACTQRNRAMTGRQ